MKKIDKLEYEKLILNNRQIKRAAGFLAEFGPCTRYGDDIPGKLGDDILKICRENVEILGTYEEFCDAPEFEEKPPFAK